MLYEMSNVNGNDTTGPIGVGSLDAPLVARIPRPRRATVRRRLLDAALKVFAEFGFESASVDQVAAAAGLTKGAVYSNFAGKDDLFFAMMSDQVMSRVEAVQAILAANPADAQPRQTLQDVGRVLTEAFTEQRDWQLVYLDFWRRAIRDDDVRARFVAHRKVLRGAIADRVEQVLDGVPTPGGFTVDDVVTVVLALSNGLVIEQYVAPEFVSDGLFGRVLDRLSG
jgi:AcrR family transcriptional regulator